MDTWLKYLFLVYLGIFFGTAFVWRSYLVWRRTGVNPYVLGGGDSPHDFVGKLFRLTLVASVAAVLVYVLVPQGLAWLVPIFWLAHPAVVIAGLILLGVALVWVLVAQAQMGAAWRIGIDDQTRTPLVQTRLFSIHGIPSFWACWRCWWGCWPCCRRR